MLLGTQPPLQSIHTTLPTPRRGIQRHRVADGIPCQGPSTRKVRARRPGAPKNGHKISDLAICQSHRNRNQPTPMPTPQTISLSLVPLLADHRTLVQTNTWTHLLRRQLHSDPMTRHPCTIPSNSHLSLQTTIRLQPFNSNPRINNATTPAMNLPFRLAPNTRFGSYHHPCPWTTFTHLALKTSTPRMRTICMDSKTNYTCLSNPCTYSLPLPRYWTMGCAFSLSLFDIHDFLYNRNTR